MSLQCHATTRKVGFFDLTQVAFWTGTEPENNMKVPSETLKQGFLDLKQVPYWDGQEAEIEFKVTCEPLKHHPSLILGFSRYRK